MIDIFSLVEKHRLLPIRSIIQVGASVGQEIDLFISSGVSSGIFIEALPDPYKLLQEKCSVIPNYITMNCLCSYDDNIDSPFYIASNYGQSSSILEPTRHKVVYPWVNFGSEVKLRAYTLDTIVASVIASRKLTNDVFDLLFMDVQGAELNVLKGASRLLNRVKYVYTEVTFGTDYRDAVSYRTLDAYLSNFGFVCTNLEIDPTFRDHGNAIFVKLSGEHILASASI